MRSISIKGWFAIAATLVACAADTSDDKDNGTNGPGGNGSNNNDGSSGNASSGGGPASQTKPQLIGVWKVRGKDSRGSYEGEVEVMPATRINGYRFVRTVHYAGIKVEVDRELHWAFVGDLTGSLTDVKITASLKRADWVSRRGEKTRTAADVPVSIGGQLVANPKGELVGKLSGPEMTLDETWTYAHPGDPTKPLFKDERQWLPGHAAPSSLEKQTSFQLYADYQNLEVIKPFKGRKEFDDAIHGNWIDKTDFDFYQTHPNALRVAQKVIDDISLGETLLRANAYRHPLVTKAALMQKDMELLFVDPDVGMVPYGHAIGSPMFPSGDAALWTGTYVAALAYRYQATGDATALGPLVYALEGLLKLQEITGDWTHFARSLHKAQGPNGDWRAGTGQYASLEWLAGGNNDMIKGLFYGYLMAHEVLCIGTLAPTYATYCNRIRTNAKHLADDVKMDLQTSDLTNKLPSSWLYAVLASDPIDRISYQAQAQGYWSAGKEAIKAAPVFYSQGTVDWSGTHLTFVGDLIEVYLARKLNLGGDAQDVMRAHIDASHHNLEKQRFAVWHLLKAAYGSGASPTSPWIDDGRWRLREIPHPKLSFDVDRRISPEFCMSPYPSVPWKQDWMQYPDPDRTQGLSTYPFFEGQMDETMWKVGTDWRAFGNVETSSADFLHVYWFARKHGLLSATE